MIYSKMSFTIYLIYNIYHCLNTFEVNSRYHSIKYMNMLFSPFYTVDTPR